MSDYSTKADKRRGKRLEKSLEKLMPDKSWRARSQLLEIPDSTVIGWRNGREISCSGLARLFSVGCDIVYILTGKEDPEHVITYAIRWMEPDETIKESVSRVSAPGVDGEAPTSSAMGDEEREAVDGNSVNHAALLHCLGAQASLTHLARLLAGDKSVVRKDFDPKSLLASFETLTSLLEATQGLDKNRDRKKA